MKRNHFVFAQALLLTMVVFVIGFYIGASVEGSRALQINSYFTQSETTLLDVLSLNKLVGSNSVSCESLVNSEDALLNKVYEGGILLDQYEESGKLTNDLKDLHKKYDSLRTYLWITSIGIKNKCGEKIIPLVYLYNKSETDLTKRAEQNVWSKVLFDIKNNNSKVVLIPIAVDSNLSSLNVLIERYNITTSPAVIVNEKKVFESIPEEKEILNYIK